MPKIVNVEEKKQEIYKSATQVFFEKGYSSTTLGDIAKASGVGRSTIYQYFKNKEEIFHGVSIFFFSELVSSLDEIISKDLSYADKELRLKGRIGEHSGLDGIATWNTTKPSMVTDWEAVAKELSPSAELIEKYTTRKAGIRRFLFKFKEAV